MSRLRQHKVSQWLALWKAAGYGDKRMYERMIVKLFVFRKIVN